MRCDKADRQTKESRTGPYRVAKGIQIQINVNQKRNVNRHYQLWVADETREDATLLTWHQHKSTNTTKEFQNKLVCRSADGFNTLAPKCVHIVNGRMVD